MNPKFLLTITIGIFLIGVLSSAVLPEEEYAGVISNISGIHTSNFVAGETTDASFSFNYQDYYGSSEYPHILKIDITSSDQINYPVWKEDFELSGYVMKSTFFGLIHQRIGLTCSEQSPLTIEHPLGTNILSVPEGTFYCYNITSSEIQNLDKHDEVFLNLKSNIALWPGTYTLTAEVFYLNDTRWPTVLITNKNDFETEYYRENDYIEVRVAIDEINLANKWGKIFANENITIPFSHKIGETYYFATNTPSNIPEGNYPLYIFADDENGNLGNDSTILKIDRTGPVIKLLQPNESGVYINTIPIELNVTDAKSGVDNSSVKYRISEIVGGTICPTTGVILGNFSCYQSGWVSIEFNPITKTYMDIFNSSELDSGEYLFESEAKDLLGNIGAL